MRFRPCAALAALLGLLCIPYTASASEAFPEKAIRLVVPFAAGGSTDIIARLLAEKLRDGWGQSVVVDNRGGAGGVVGSEIVAQATADGYTLLMASGSIMTAHKYMYKLPFDPDKAFVPITNVVRAPQVVLVPSASQMKTINDLVAFGKANPRNMKYGSAGVGSQIHLGAELLLYAAGVSGVHVPYRGGGPALAALASNEIQLVVPNLPSGMTLIKTGKARAIAVTSKERAQQLPSVPTVAESIPGFESEGWFGVVAPAATPQAIVKTIYAATVNVLRDARNKPRFDALGMSPVGNSPAEFKAEIQSESKLWKKVIGERNLAVR